MRTYTHGSAPALRSPVCKWTDDGNHLNHIESWDLLAHQRRGATSPSGDAARRCSRARKQLGPTPAPVARTSPV